MSQQSRQPYREGSVYQAHRADCPSPGLDGIRPDHSCSGRWVASLEAGWNDRGKRRRVVVTARTEALVRKKLRDRKNEIAKAAGQVTNAARMRTSVKAWSDEWLKMRVTSTRPKTYESDESALRLHVVPTIGAKRLVDLTPMDLRAVAAKQRAKKIGPPGILRAYRTMIKMLRDAVEEGYPIAPGIFNVKAPSGGPASDREALSTPEAVAVLQKAEPSPFGLRWLVAFYQGLRQGEALGLTWDAVDWEANTLTIAWQLQALKYKIPRDRKSGFRVPDGFEARHLEGRFHLVRPKTASGWRVIPMVPTIKTALEKWRSDQVPNPHGLLWARSDGWPIDKGDDAEVWRALQAEAGVAHPTGRPYKGHEIRNTTATLLLEAGVDPVVITAILGHSSYVTSKGYMAVRSGPLTAALKQIEAAFTGDE